MVLLNKVSLTELLERESTLNLKSNKPAWEDDDDHTETTFSIDDSFVGFHDDSLKSHGTWRSECSVVDEGNGFEKVPMSWLPSYQRANSFKSQTSSSEEEEEEQELDMRDLLRDSRMMSDCSFKPHESMNSVDMRDFMRQTGRTMSDCSFEPQTSMASEGWGSMRDLLFDDPEDPAEISISDSGNFSSMLGDAFCDSTFARNLDFLQTTTFVKNLDFLQNKAKELTESAGEGTGFIMNMILGN